MTDDNEFLTDVARECPDCLRDESRRVGRADSVSFPKTEEDVKRHLARARDLKMPVTIQGARTGIAAGAVPDGGHVLNLSRMNCILGLRRDEATGEFRLTVQPGLLLADLRKYLKEDAEKTFRESGGRYFFVPDPTESSASLGGMVACNASGARSFSYGATRRHVTRLRVILADGSAIELRRGEQKAAGRTFFMATDTGRRVEGMVPLYAMPDVKNAAGYFAAENMDLVDLFIGAEGTLGVVTEIELRLIPLPKIMWGVMAFFPAEEPAVQFAKGIRDLDPRPVAVEFFDHGALDLLRRQREKNPAFTGIPDMPVAWHTAVYVEYHGDVEDAVESAVMHLSETMSDCGGDGNATWISSDEREMERLKDFRHAVPEAVNLLIDERRKKEPGLTKLGTDLAVPDDALEEMLALYHKGLAEEKLEYVMFGHIGDNHLHVNIIPNSLEEYERGKTLYLRWARHVVVLGGTVSAEHGIGKLKKALLKEMYGATGIDQMQALKRVFDPAGMLNPGNLF